jgi:hypothetical protein
MENAFWAFVTVQKLGQVEIIFCLTKKKTLGAVSLLHPSKSVKHFSQENIILQNKINILIFPK